MPAIYNILPQQPTDKIHYQLLLQPKKQPIPKRIGCHSLQSY